MEYKSGKLGDNNIMQVDDNVRMYSSEIKFNVLIRDLKNMYSSI